MKLLLWCPVIRFRAFILMHTWFHDFYWQTAASNSLWPEYEITCEDECDFDEAISNDNGTGSALVSRSRTEGSDGNLIKYFKVILFSGVLALYFNSSESF